MLPVSNISSALANLLDAGQNLARVVPFKKISVLRPLSSKKEDNAGEINSHLK